ncbi:MAG: hypothetical protein P4L33_09920 [Capsulimonadaceae bacterium]|nr:hypothetical protein [Capsulimonadaceae bacterium]
MLIGWLLTVVLGVLWGAIGIVMSSARAWGIAIFTFYTVGCSFAALLGAAVCQVTGTGDALAADAKTIPFIACLAAIALFNCAGQALTMFNLHSGGRSVVYALPQVGFLAPMAYGALAWNEPFGGAKIVGLVLIIAAIIATSKTRKSSEQAAALTPRRLLIALGALASIGASQIFVILCGRVCRDKAASPLVASTLLLLVSAVIYGGYGLLRQAHVRVDARLAQFSAAWALLALVSFSVLFAVLPAMSPYKLQGVVFAAASAIGIVIFAVFSHLRQRERFSAQSICALAMILLGIFALRLG